jgi:hypothetical protein
VLCGHQFFVDNYSPQENVDNDDGSSYYKTHDNFFVYVVHSLYTLGSVGRAPARGGGWGLPHRSGPKKSTKSICTVSACEELGCR